MRQKGPASSGIIGLTLWLSVWLAAYGGAAAFAEDATDKPSTNPATEAGREDTCKRASFRILIDVGHTPEDPGAISAHGNPEYGYNLALANLAMTQLVEAGFRQTTLLLVRGRGYGQLAQRAEIANRSAPDLLLSIHHDSTRERYIKTWEFAGVRRNYSDKFSGHSLFVSLKNRHYRQSVEFAKLIGRELASAGLQYTPQHAEDIPTARLPLVDAELGVYRYDNLVVLKNTHMPAVLFEAGLIINRKDELVLSTPERKALLSTAIANAVLDYCRTNQAKSPPRERRFRPAIAKSNGKRSG
jgi:N-acetylmuramoyl-L-alanine amidase